MPLAIIRRCILENIDQPTQMLGRGHQRKIWDNVCNKHTIIIYCSKLNSYNYINTKSEEVSFLDVKKTSFHVLDVLKYKHGFL